VKLLVDENLSPQIATAFQGDFPGSTHVHWVGLGSAPDDEIWRYARDQEFTIVTRDADYHERSLFSGFPPKVIWIRIGNATTADIEAALRSHRDAIRQLEADPGLAVLVI